MFSGGFAWSATVLETSPHGAVAWAARAEDGDAFSLWRFDREAGWTDLKPQGKLFKPYCDSDGMTYDAKRDRMLIGWGGGYQKAGDGRIYAFEFGSRKVEQLAPANAELGRIHNTREMVYLDHADWVLFGEPLVAGQGKTAKRCQRVYDCAKNSYFLMDAPGHPGGGHSQGWQYDAKRKLVYAVDKHGNAWALRLDPAEAKLLDKAPGTD